MIQIKIEKSGVVEPLRFSLGNQYENNDEALGFTFPEELSGCYKYLIATHKETGKTITLPINEAQISVSSALTWLAGEWLMQVLFKATELDLKDDVVSISNQFYGFVKKASFKAENLKEAPTDENIKVYYESMKQSIIDEVVAQVGVGGGSGVSDVLVNDATIVDENGNANIPIADGVTLGLVQTNVNGGVTINAKGQLFLTIATESDYTNRNKNTRVVTSSNYDLAVKTAMCDGVGTEWTPQEKAMAQERMGLNWKLLGDVTVEEDDVTMVEIPIDNPNYNEFQFFIVLADRSDTTSKSMLVNFDGLITTTYTLASFGVATSLNYTASGYTQRCCDGWLTFALGGSGNLISSVQNINGGRANNYSTGPTWNTEKPHSINVSLATGLDIGSRFVVYAR